MATFPDIAVSYGAQKSSAPRTRTVQFGDGYQQRLLYGIPSHMNPKEWQLSWENITEADSDTIETFLDARAEDAASFDWTPPDEATSYKLGMLKIEELRAKAEAELGGNFDIKAFHDEILLTGSMPLPVLEARINRWIEAEKS